MPDSPFFSIIIPTYNRMNFIRRTISSLLAQDFSDFELIVVDDGSTDQTDEAVKSIGDRRIRYLKKGNEERAAARNYGAFHARGEYVNFFDSDDVAYPWHLSTARDFIDTHSLPNVFALHYDFRNTKNHVVKIADPVSEINKAILHGNYLSCNGVFIRGVVSKENLFNQDRDLSSLEDWELWIRLAARYPFLNSEKVTSSVIQHDERSVMTSDTDRIRKKVDRFIRYVLEDPRNVKYYGNNLRKATASARTYAALHLAVSNAPKDEIWHYLKNGVKDYPGEIFRKRFLVILKLMIGITI